MPRRRAGDVSPLACGYYKHNQGLDIPRSPRAEYDSWYSQANAQVHHVCVCRAGFEQAINGIEKVIGIMSGKVLAEIQVALRDAADQMFVGNCSSGICRAIFTVSSG